MAEIREFTGVPADEEEAPKAAPPGPEVDPTETRLQKLELEIRRLWIRNTDFRNKIFAIQQAVVEGAGLTECALGHAAADVFPVEVQRDPGAPVRIFAFGSMGANSGMAPKQFFNAFKKHRCEIFFFKDFRQCWYQQGLLGLSKDIASTAAYLRTLTAGDDRPVSMLGASSGGFAALLFGAMLGAHKVVAFSPQTLITNRVFHRFKTEDSQIGEVAFNSRYADVKTVLEDHPLRGRADIFFSRRAPFDASEANRLEGLPGVNLQPLEWNGHNTAALLRNQGRLDGIIQDLVTP